MDVKGKTVLVRVDINEPVDKAKNELKDITRIEGYAPTIKELSDKGAKLVVMAHQGSDIEYGSYYTLRCHTKELSLITGRSIEFVPDVCGPYAQEKMKRLKEGEILLLENVRYMAEEMTLFETKLNLTPEQQSKTVIVQKLHPLADIYVCDAFAAAHRSQPTLVGFEELLPSAMGRLFEKEYAVLSEILEEPQKPLVFVLGRAKIQDAFMMMDTVLSKGVADKVLTGGLVAHIMLMANGTEIGKPSTDYIYNNNLAGFVEISKGLLKRFKDKIILPADFAYADERRTTIRASDLPVNNLLLDIGEETAEEYKQEVMKAETVFANGPMGVFEKEHTEYDLRILHFATVRA